jgi:D-arabinose 1-dehydrogenase-like Zn-dependent alcohol dehydrogenase
MALMNAVTFPEFGPPSVLTPTQIERPEPKHGDALVKIHSAGICYHDLLSRAGRIPRDQPGQVLGHEISGQIVKLGSGVAESRLGERVVVYQRLYCGECRFCLSGRHDLCRNSKVLGEAGGGGYAEFTCVPARNLIHVPAAVELGHAALAVCPIGTSVRALVGVAQVKPGDVVLVTGAGGGLGLHQIQIAKAFNARVIAVTSSEQKAEAVRAVGADEVVVAPDLKFSREVWGLTDKAGADIVLENVVSGTIGESLRSCAQNAAIIILGNIGTRPVEIDPGLVIVRRLRIAGSGNATYADVNMALNLMAAGKVKPVINSVLPFKEVGHGHSLMEQRDTIGRIVLNGW